MDFYNRFYSPNNAFLVVVGDVSHETVFAQAEKYFGVITKQLPSVVAVPSPDLMNAHVKITEMGINYPLQDYCFAFPQPAATDKDFFAYDLLMSVLFTDDNSILNERLVKQEHSAYLIMRTNDAWSLFPSRSTVDVFMSPMPGNLKVKKAIREEMDKIIANGLPQDKVDDFIANKEASEIMSSYSSETIAGELGMAEYYFHDYNRAGTIVNDYKAVTKEDVKRVAAKYLSADHVDMINIKPTE
jgi:zinc protease